MNAEARRTKIRELIEEGGFGSQGELSSALTEAGFTISQPMLSRDLHALGVAKIAGTYQWIESERVTPLDNLASMLRGTSPVQTLRLVHCEPGAASAIARALEASEIEGLVGSVAGDDTVLVALQDDASAHQLETRINALLD